MNRIAALVVGYLVLALEAPVRKALQLGDTGAAPSIVVPFVVFVALNAPAAAALWTAMICGLVVDVMSPRGGPVGAPVVLGPHALGFMGAAYLTLTARPLLMRSNPVALVVFSVLGGMVAGVVATSLLSLRGLWGPELGVGAPASAVLDLRDRALGALYTGATALAMAALLLPMQGLFGFQDPTRRGPFVRRN